MINKKALIIFLFPAIFYSQKIDNIEVKQWKLYKYYNYYLKRISENVLHNFYFKSSTNNKEIAITFDDGPLKNTDNIISLLLEQNVPATFFVVTGKLNKSNYKYYQHGLIDIGIHTHSHLDYSKLTKKEKYDDINKSIKIFNLYGFQIKYFRPAYGIIDKDIAEILRLNNLKGIIWSLDSQDWNRFRGKKLIDNIINNIDNGDIILFHDRIDISDLKKIIIKIKSKGFKIVSLKNLTRYRSKFPY